MVKPKRGKVGDEGRRPGRDHLCPARRTTTGNCETGVRIGDERSTALAAARMHRDEVTKVQCVEDGVMQLLRQGPQRKAIHACRGGSRSRSNRKHSSGEDLACKRKRD